jgi:hypothetical protein
MEGGGYFGVVVSSYTCYFHSKKSVIFGDYYFYFPSIFYLILSLPHSFLILVLYILYGNKQGEEKITLVCEFLCLLFPLLFFFFPERLRLIAIVIYLWW